MKGKDRRSARTRGALIGAFNQLFLTRGRRAVRVAELVSAAGVGRSTFYDHYSGTNALFLDALAAPLAVLADAAAGRGAVERLEPLLAHFWQNRQRARDVLIGPSGERVARLLAEQVAARLGDRPLALPRPIAARMLGDAAIAPVRVWLIGEASCSAGALAGALCAAGEGLILSLGAPGRVTAAG